MASTLPALFAKRNAAGMRRDPFLGSAQRSSRPRRSAASPAASKLDPLYADVTVRRFEAVTARDTNNGAARPAQNGD
jgi:hypothetical protein